MESLLKLIRSPPWRGSLDVVAGVTSPAGLTARNDDSAELPFRHVDAGHGREIDRGSEIDRTYLPGTMASQNFIGFVTMVPWYHRPLAQRRTRTRMKTISLHFQPTRG